MGSKLEGEDDDFFDADQEIASATDCDSDGSGDSHNTDVPRLTSSISNCLQYEAWTQSPSSVRERRRSFMQFTGISSTRHPLAAAESTGSPKSEVGMHRLTKSSGAVPLNEASEDGSSPSRPSTSNDEPEAEVEVVSEAKAEVEVVAEAKPEAEEGIEKNLVCTVKNLDNPTQHLEYVVEVGREGEIGTLREVGSNRLISLEDFESSFSTNLVQQLLRKEEESKSLNDKKKSKSSKRNWMKRLGSKVRLPSRQWSGSFKSVEDLVTLPGEKPAMRRVRVMPFKKNVKELTSLHSRQDFEAHDGSVLSMRFSFDGQYLATAGGDGMVRVWEVSEDARLDESDIPEDDSSCMYFPMNQPSKLAALDANKEKMKRLKKSKDMACAVLPPKFFWISENPLHEFEGHGGDVLDLSWSKDGYLLSSSTDKTVRLWKLGRYDCLNVFSHNNYVTCVSFNPMDNDYFISGSIDGLVRIWEISACQVVHYINVREIITAVSYRPNGKEAIVGAMSSNCYFVHVSDNRFHMEANISLKSKKKKKPSRRVTGFQFCPTDPRKVLITAADSSVRILCDKVVQCKFKGPIKGGSHISAAFTPDGKHIISANEDSNVRVWNYKSLDRGFSGSKKIRSCESFLSDNALLALPWCGSATATTTEPKVLRAQTFHALENTWKKFLERRHTHGSSNPAPSPECLPLARSKGSGTWPEEKISPMTAPTGSKSEYKLLKSAWQSMSGSDNMWGVVIVTAGCDGRIRTYQNYGLPVRI